MRNSSFKVEGGRAAKSSKVEEGHRADHVDEPIGGFQKNAWTGGTQADSGSTVRLPKMIPLTGNKWLDRISIKVSVPKPGGEERLVLNGEILGKKFCRAGKTTNPCESVVGEGAEQDNFPGESGVQRLDLEASGGKHLGCSL